MARVAALLGSGKQLQTASMEVGGMVLGGGEEKCVGTWRFWAWEYREREIQGGSFKGNFGNPKSAAGAADI